MSVNPFLKRMMKVKKEDVIHTSAYAEAQNQGGIGAASTESFERRRQVDNSRTRVQAYDHSEIANGSLKYMPRAKTYEGVKMNMPNAGAPKMVTPPVRKNPGISR